MAAVTSHIVPASGVVYRVDAAIAAEVLRVVQPAAIEAAILLPKQFRSQTISKQQKKIEELENKLRERSPPSR